MFIKRIKYILITLGVLYSLFLIIITIVRLPSYTIHTSGKLYVVNKIGRDIQVFNLFTGEEIADIPIDMQSHEVVTTKDENNIIVTNYGTHDSDGTIKVINTKTNEVEKTIKLKGNMRANGITDFSKPNEVAIVDYVSNDVVVLNIETGRVIRQIKTKQKKSHLLVLHPKKSLAYVTNMESNSVSVINLITNKVDKIIHCGLTTESIDITPDGSEIWVTNKNSNSITVIDALKYKIIDTLSTGEEPLKVKFSKNGRHCLVANASEGTIAVYDQESKKKIKTIWLHGKTTFLERVLYHTPRPVNILMHPNGLYAFIANSNANEIEVVDMKTFTVVSTIGTGEIPDALAFVG